MWSFSPPEDVLEREPTAAQRLLQLPPRPISAAGYRTNIKEDQQMTGIIANEAYTQDDIDMADAGPSTAPPHSTGPTFFHDDD